MKKTEKFQVIIMSFALIFGFSCSRGLIANYPFNGNANDLSPNKNNGVVEGAVLSPDKNGQSNCSYYFDGKDDYILIKDFGKTIKTKEITVSMWVKSLTSKPQFQMMLVPDHNRFAISINYFHDGRNTIFWDYGWQGEGGNAPGRLYFRPEPLDNLWHHYVFVSSLSENRMKIYKDKVLLIEKNEPRELNSPNFKDLIIGSGDKSFFFNGYIDEIKVYNRALNSKEIEGLYNK